jgi:hypothetical protein
MVLLCLWIELDLAAFASGSGQGFWSWIVSGSSVGLVLANTLSKLSFGLAIFLVIVVAAEVFVIFHAGRKVDVFAEECLKTLE